MINGTFSVRILQCADFKLVAPNLANSKEEIIELSQYMKDTLNHVELGAVYLLY